MNKTQKNILAQKEYKQKMALKKRLEKYYKNQAVKEGLKSFDKVAAYLPDKLQSKQMRRGLVVAHLEIEPIIELVASKKEFTIVSGLSSSSSLHFGHKIVFDVLLELQRLGGKIFIPVTNDEAYVDGKISNLSESRRVAYEEIIKSVVAFGFKPSKTQVFVDTDYPEIYKFAMHLSKYITVKEVETVFGKESMKNPGQVFYRSVVQMAQILLPQLPEFGGPKPTLIPVGIDQHPYILLARDVAKRLKMVPPSELVFKFQQSLRDPEKKMSGSKPSTAIYLSDTKLEINKKIKKAYTGSVSVMEVHQELGGVPEICSVFSLLNSQMEDDEMVKKIYKDYVEGKLSMDKLKKRVAKLIVEVVGEHQEKRKKVTEKRVDKFLLKKSLRSFLDY